VRRSRIIGITERVKKVKRESKTQKEDIRERVLRERSLREREREKGGKKVGLPNGGHGGGVDKENRPVGVARAP
jgi:hypothetical protein